MFSHLIEHHTISCTSHAGGAAGYPGRGLLNMPLLLVTLLVFSTPLFNRRA
jgi:hypothetical protein